MRQWARSTLVQILVCRLIGAKPLPERSLNAHFLSIRPIEQTSGIFFLNSNISIHKKAFENFVWEMVAILSGGEGELMIETSIFQPCGLEMSHWSHVMSKSLITDGVMTSRHQRGNCLWRSSWTHCLLMTASAPWMCHLTLVTRTVVVTTWCTRYQIRLFMETRSQWQIAYKP